MRGRFAKDTKTLEQMNALHSRISELEAELAQARIAAPAGSEELAQDEDEFDVTVTLTNDTTNDIDSSQIKTNWGDIFSCVAPSMFNEATEKELRGLLDGRLWTQVDRTVWDHPDQYTLNIDDDSFHTVLTQLKALGLIAVKHKKRAPSDRNTYWTLTPYGKTQATRRIAIKRKSDPNKVP